MLPWFLSKEFQELQILKCQYFSLDFDIKENYIFKKLHRGSEKSLWSKFHWCFFIKTNDDKNHENYVDNHYLTSRGQFFFFRDHPFSTYGKVCVRTKWMISY